MYKISDFANRTGVSTDTLRYYDKIDFFKPSYVDFFTGYRYYEEDQVNVINKITKLKELDLSIDEIKEYLETKDNQILINKRRELESIMDKIDNILNDKGNNYRVEKADYKKYVELNGIKQADCPQALEVRDNNAYYFVLYNNDKFFLDFCLFKEENWLTLSDSNLLDKELSDFVIEELKKYVDEIRFYIPIEDEKIISFLKDNYNIVSEDIFKQGGYEYKEILINIKEK